MSSRDKELKEEYQELASMVAAIPATYRHHQYATIVEEAKIIFEDRNKMYKDAFVALGLIGTISTLIGDCFRLKFMVYDSPDHGRQYKAQIRDKLLDIINQAIISIFVLDDENYTGR